MSDVNTDYNIDIAKLQILGDRVLVQEHKNTHSSGFFLIENSKDKPFCGTVVKVGDGKVKNDSYNAPVKIGDKILFQKWNSQDLLINNNRYMCVKFDDVLGILND